MRILLLNPPHIAIGSRIPREQLPPLGLLSIGGPLIDAGHLVTLLDAELGPLPHDTVVARAVAHRPQVLMIGHSGSNSAHPIAMSLTKRIVAALPEVIIVYGGVFPTYHYREGLAAEPHIGVIVRGEGVQVFDEHGKAYIEGMSGLWCASLGFSEKRLADVAYQQMTTLPYYHSFSGKVPGPVTALVDQFYGDVQAMGGGRWDTSSLLRRLKAFDG